MSLAHTLVAELDHEMAGVRTTLERVPEDRLDYRPHEKSMTMARLAGHLAEMPDWAVQTLRKEALDMAPPGEPPRSAFVMTSRAQVLDRFDRELAEARDTLVTATDEDLGRSWTLLAGGRVVLTMPRLGVLRTFVLNHAIHHRAQLGVYLRLNGVPVPSLYGPSADESGA